MTEAQNNWQDADGSVTLDMSLGISDSDLASLEILEKTLANMAVHAQNINQALSGIGGIATQVNATLTPDGTPTPASGQPAQTPGTPSGTTTAAQPTTTPQPPTSSASVAPGGSQGTSEVGGQETTQLPQAPQGRSDQTGPSQAGGGRQGKGQPAQTQGTMQADGSMVLGSVFASAFTALDGLSSPAEIEEWLNNLVGGQGQREKFDQWWESLDQKSKDKYSDRLDAADERYDQGIEQERQDTENRAWAGEQTSFRDMMSLADAQKNRRKLSDEELGQLQAFEEMYGIGPEDLANNADVIQGFISSNPMLRDTQKAYQGVNQGVEQMQLGNKIMSASGAGLGMRLMGGAGVALGAYQAANVANDWVQDRGQDFQDVRDLGNVQGKGFWGGAEYRAEAWAMGQNPFLSDRDATDIVRRAAEAGYSGEEFHDATQFMQRNLIDANISAAESMKMLRENVEAGGQSIDNLSTQMSILKDAAVESNISLGDMVKQYQAVSEAGVSAGIGGQSAGMAGIVAATAFSDDPVLQDVGGKIVAKGLTEQEIMRGNLRLDSEYGRTYTEVYGAIEDDPAALFRLIDANLGGYAEQARGMEPARAYDYFYEMTKTYGLDRNESNALLDQYLENDSFFTGAHEEAQEMHQERTVAEGDTGVTGAVKALTGVGLLDALTPGDDYAGKGVAAIDRAARGLVTSTQAGRTVAQLGSDGLGLTEIVSNLVNPATAALALSGIGGNLGITSDLPNAFLKRIAGHATGNEQWVSDADIAMAENRQERVVAQARIGGKLSTALEELLYANAPENIAFEIDGVMTPLSEMDASLLGTTEFQEGLSSGAIKVAVDSTGQGNWSSSESLTEHSMSGASGSAGLDPVTNVMVGLTPEAARLFQVESTHVSQANQGVPGYATNNEPRNPSEGR